MESNQVANAPQPRTSDQVDAQAQTWLIAAQARVNQDYARTFPDTPERAPVLRLETKSRYVAVWSTSAFGSGSIFAFIDRTGGKINGATSFPGDVLKPAGCNAPAKHARGNIFDSNGGVASLSWTGPAYLR